MESNLRIEERYVIRSKSFDCAVVMRAVRIDSSNYFFASRILYHSI